MVLAVGLSLVMLGLGRFGGLVLLSAAILLILVLVLRTSASDHSRSRCAMRWR